MTARSIVLSAMILVAVTVSVAAQSRLMFGQGTQSCGAWTEAHQNRSFTAGLQAQWIAGYLSGSNLESTLPDFLIGSDFDGIMKWVDNYCKAHPLDPLVKAAQQLMTELRSR